jgi:hypothetical protein
MKSPSYRATRLGLRSSKLKSKIHQKPLPPDKAQTAGDSTPLFLTEYQIFNAVPWLSNTAADHGTLHRNRSFKVNSTLSTFVANFRIDAKLSDVKPSSELEPPNLNDREAGTTSQIKLRGESGTSCSPLKNAASAMICAVYVCLFCFVLFRVQCRRVSLFA